jgi:hypothetical protein
MKELDNLHRKFASLPWRNTKNMYFFLYLKLININNKYIYVKKCNIKLNL